MTLKIEDGKYYRTRAGRKVGPVYANYRGHAWPWSVPQEAVTYADDGTHWADRSESARDLVAEWTDEPETGTLAQLNVKPGDVVEFEMRAGEWRRHSISCVKDGIYYSADTGESLGNVRPWSIVSRASQPDTPKLWRDMTAEEKGALLLAHHEGKVIEIYCDGYGWKKGAPSWSGDNAYRICPEPKRETVSIYCDDTESKGNIRRIGTIELIDGIPDPASIRMEEL